MAIIKRRLSENEGKEFAYVVLHNGMDDVFNEIDKFCKGEYGRECDLYEAYIAERDPNNYPAKVQGFDGVGADLLEQVRNHLERSRDFIKFDFSSAEGQFSIDIIPATEEAFLEDRMDQEDLDELETSDTVIMVEMDDGEDVDEAEQFLENL